MLGYVDDDDVLLTHMFMLTTITIRNNYKTQEQFKLKYKKYRDAKEHYDYN